MLSRFVTLVVHKVCDVLKVVTLVGGVIFVLPILRHLYVQVCCCSLRSQQHPCGAVQELEQIRLFCVV